MIRINRIAMNRRQLFLGALITLFGVTPSFAEEDLKSVLQNKIIDLYNQLYGHFIFEIADRETIRIMTDILASVLEVDLKFEAIDAYFLSSVDGRILISLSKNGVEASKGLVIGEFKSDLIFRSNMSNTMKKRYAT